MRSAAKFCAGVVVGAKVLLHSLRLAQLLPTPGCGCQCQTFQGRQRQQPEECARRPGGPIWLLCQRNLQRGKSVYYLVPVVGRPPVSRQHSPVAHSRYRHQQTSPGCLACLACLAARWLCKWPAVNYINYLYQQQVSQVSSLGIDTYVHTRTCINTDHGPQANSIAAPCKCKRSRWRLPHVNGQPSPLFQEQPGLPRAGRLPAAAWHEDHNLSRQPRKACRCLLIYSSYHPGHPNLGMCCGLR